MKRAEKLYQQLRGAYRQTLLTSMVLRMNDDERDLRLQERVQGRLYADGKWSKSVAIETLTFNDVRDMIWECRSSTTEKLTRNEEDTLPASELDPMRIWLCQQETFTELAQHIKDHTILTSKRIDHMETSQNPRPAFRNDNPDFHWCFKCGEWGHMGYNCPLQNQFDRGEFRRRQDEWANNREELCRQRAE
ncbi:hypothetical protein N0V84_012435 [Fusarium piperis]|uniref:CCHC-type domain-containing protein n=1 Tax=Fusarium piperis TaxID=1435070 RepID=A0A9W8T8P0_9HYPO|nr:hypothetical protein N0V84_012435 [Fusarium piperis]